jgi:pimeloyl-ACP methyl ester carboxylesterase
VRQSLAAQRAIVEERIRTIKIPTLLIGGRRYDRVVSEETLRGED